MEEGSRAPVCCAAAWGRERVLAAPLLGRKRGFRESGGRARDEEGLWGEWREGEGGRCHQREGDGGNEAAREGESEGAGYLRNLTYVYILVNVSGLGLGQILGGGPYKITVSVNDLPRRLHYNACLGK